MSRRLSRTTHHDEDGVNMTPMLDIVFILLIFFIVTAVFLDETGIDFTQANNDGPPGQPISAISIVINAQDEISVEGRFIPLTLVESEVELHIINRPDAFIDLRAAETARLENVVIVKDEMESSGRTVQFKTFIPTLSTAQLQ